jgi:hypothetical protein
MLRTKLKLAGDSDVALDAELEGSLFRTTNLTTSYQGGYLLQSFAGIKAGKRWEKFGIFGKFRPGTVKLFGSHQAVPIWDAWICQTD